MNIIVKAAKIPVIKKRLGSDIQATRVMTFKELESTYSPDFNAIILEDMEFTDSQINRLKEMSSLCMVKLVADSNHKDSIKQVRKASENDIEIIEAQFIVEELLGIDIGNTIESKKKVYRGINEVEHQENDRIIDISNKRDMDMQYRIVSDDTAENEAEAKREENSALSREIIERLEKKVVELSDSKRELSINNAKEMSRLSDKVKALEAELIEANDHRLMDMRVTELELDIAELTRERDLLNIRIESMGNVDDEIKALTSKMAVLQADLTEAKKDNSALSRINKEYQAILADISVIILGESIDSSKIKGLPDEITRKVNDNKDNLDKLNGELDGLREKLSEVTEDARVKKERLMELELAVSSEKKLSDRYKEMHKESEESKKLMQSEYAAAVSDKQIEIDRYKEEVTRLQEESIDLQREVDEKEERLRMHEEIDRDMSEKDIELASERHANRVLRMIVNKAVEIKIPEILVEKNIAKENAKRSEEQIVKLRKDLSTLNRELESYKSKLHEAIEKAEQLNSDKDSSKNKMLEERMELINKLQDDLSRANKELLDESTDRQKLKEEFQRKMDEYRNSMSDIAIETAEKDDKIIELQNEIMEMRRSMASHDVEVNKIKRETAAEAGLKSGTYSEPVVTNIVENYTGGANIYAIAGSGSFGITSIAMSILDKLRKTKTVYVDLDICNPKADSWFIVNPMISKLKEIKSDALKTGIGALVEVGADYVEQNIDSILLHSDSMSINTRYVSGVYSRVSDAKVIKSDLGSMLNCLAERFDNIVIDCGKIGNCVGGDSIIHSVFSIANNKAIVTTNDIMDVRNTLLKINSSKISREGIVWVLNMSINSDINAKVKGMTSDFSVVQIPIHPQYYGRKTFMDTVTILRPKIASIMNFMQGRD